MRILVADDSDTVRRGIVGLLAAEKSFEVCGEVANGADCLLRARELRPELVLLDISMPGLNGLEVASQLRREFPDLKILILSHHDPAVMEASTRTAGADGCIDKGRLGTELLPKVRTLLAEPKP
jgi:DNA-binding NarL/FixJ family response regulator